MSEQRTSNVCVCMRARARVWRVSALAALAVFLRRLTVRDKHSGEQLECTRLYGWGWGSEFFVLACVPLLAWQYCIGSHSRICRICRICASHIMCAVLYAVLCRNGLY